MMTKYLWAVVLWTLITGSMFAGCRRHAADDPAQNVFYNITHQAETFGFTDTTFIKLQTTFKQNKSPDFRSAFYYYNYGCGYYHTNTNIQDESMALKYADSMLLLCEQANPATDQVEIAIANLSEGDILFALKRYTEACEYYYNGKIAAEKSGDQYTLSEYSYRLGMAMYRQEKYDTAAHYFINAFEQGGYRKNSFSDFYRRQEVLGNTALSYLRAGKPDSAAWYSNKGLQYIAANEPNFTADKNELIQCAYGVLYGVLGQSYLQSGDAAGEQWLQKSIRINLAPGREKNHAMQMQAVLAGYYLDNLSGGHLPKAYTTLIAIRQGLDTLHDEEVAIQWNWLMNRYFAAQNNKEAAYDYLTYYNKLHDQQLAANKALAETNITSLQKLVQDRYELQLLQANNQLKTVYLQIAALLCVLIGIILFLLVRNRKKEKESIRVLTQLNKQVEQQKIQLEATVKQLNEQIKTKDYILRVVAHDLRNPISAISTLTRIVAEEYENEEENKEFLEMAQSACKDSLAMIESIMQLSQHGKPELLKQKVLDANETALDSVDLLRLKAGEKDQSIVLHTTDMPQYIYADADKLARVVNNLVMNAIKFSFPHSTIDVYVKDMQDKVEIVVKDEGIGIPEALQAKVFDVFTEAKRKGTAKEGTFGLGLSICKQLVEAHGGTIWLESKEGAGAAFHVSLLKHTLPYPEPEYEVEEIV